VRAVREKIVRQRGGNFKDRLEATNRIGEFWQAKPIPTRVTMGAETK